MGKYTLPFHQSAKSHYCTTNMFDVVRIISSKQQIFSVRSSPHTKIFKKIAVRSSPDPAKIGFSPDPFLIPAHLCCPGNLLLWNLSLNWEFQQRLGKNLGNSGIQGFCRETAFCGIKLRTVSVVTHFHQIWESDSCDFNVNSRILSTALPIWHNFCQILKIGHNFDAFGKKVCGLFCQKDFWHNLAYFSYFE